MYRILVTLSVMALSVMGCGDADVVADPLVGPWTASTTNGALTLTTTLTLNSGDTMRVTDAGRGACSGARSYEGLTWSKSATTVTFAGTARCSGEIVCVNAGVTDHIPCPSTASQPMTGACGYSLSSDANSLTLRNCSGNSGSSTTYARGAVAR